MKNKIKYKYLFLNTAEEAKSSDISWSNVLMECWCLRNMKIGKPYGTNKKVYVFMKKHFLQDRIIQHIGDWGPLGTSYGLIIIASQFYNNIFILLRSCWRSTMGRHQCMCTPSVLWNGPSCGVSSSAGYLGTTLPLLCRAYNNLLSSLSIHRTF